MTQNVSQAQQAQIYKDKLDSRKEPLQRAQTQQKIRGYGDKDTRLARALEYLKSYKLNDTKSIIDEFEVRLDGQELDSKSTRSKLTKQNLYVLEQETPDSENLVKLLEDVPEELREYIIEEIIQEINNLQADQIEISKIDTAHSQRQKLIAALNKRK